MTRYAAGQLVLAFIVTALGTVRAIRLLVDMTEDSISELAGLR